MFGLDKYHYRASKTYMVYAFQSQGLKGVIEKIAKFTSLGTNVYNFGFGDLDPVTGNISDTITSNNGDIDTIMGTLGSIVYDFTNIFMEALIIIEGTDSARIIGNLLRRESTIKQLQGAGKAPFYCLYNGILY
jgi:hypothetical protein